MAHGVQHAAEGRGAAQAHGQGQDAHVLHAGVGQHALVVALSHDEDGGHEHGDQAEEDQQRAAEAAQARAQHDLVPAQDAQEGTVEQGAGQQGRDQRGGLAMGVGQPVVQGRQAHLGAVAHQQEDEGRLEPGQIGGCALGRIQHGQGFGALLGQMAEGLHLVHAFHRRHTGLVESHGKQDVAQQGQGDAHGTDDEVLPGGFQRLLVAVEVDQGRAGQGGDLDAHPQGA